MKNFVLLIFFFQSINLLGLDLKSPVNFEHYCTENEIIFQWNGAECDIAILSLEGKTAIIAKNVNSPFIWKPDRPKFYDEDISFRLTEYQSGEIAEVSGVRIISKPKIIKQTGRIVKCIGETAILEVDALGFGLNYRWEKDGSIVPGEHESVLDLGMLNEEKSGIYQCIITGSQPCGEIRSEPIAVYAVTETKITGQPKDAFWNYLGLAAFECSAHVNGAPPGYMPEYQWYRDTLVYRFDTDPPRIDTHKVKITDSDKFSGAKTNVLTVNNLIWKDQVNYYCEVSGICGTAISEPATVKKSGFFIVRNVTPNYSNCAGNTASFRVEVETNNPGAISYQWMRTGNHKIEEGGRYSGTKSERLVIDSITPGDAGALYCKVTHNGIDVSQNSDLFILTIFTEPVITVHPKDFTVNDRENNATSQGQTYIWVAVEYQGSNFPHRFDWFRNDSIVRTVVHPSVADYWLGDQFFPRAAEKSDIGSYVCRITNKCGQAWSDTAEVKWGFPDVAACEGRNASLSVTYLGSDWVYRWYKQGNQLYDNPKYSGEYTNELQINDITIADSGYYFVEAVNHELGEQKEIGEIYLQVSQKPIIKLQLPDVMEIDYKGYLRAKNLSVYTISNLNWELYHNGELYSQGVYELFSNSGTHVAVYFGGGRDFEEGEYYYVFSNSCGSVKSEVTTVVNDMPGEIPDEPGLHTSVLDGENIAVSGAYPNPADDIVRLDLYAESNQTAEVEISGISGEIVYTGNSELGAGLNTVNIFCGNMRRGIYFISIFTIDGVVSRKFIKK